MRQNLWINSYNNDNNTLKEMPSSTIETLYICCQTTQLIINIIVLNSVKWKYRHECLLGARCFGKAEFVMASSEND